MVEKRTVLLMVEVVVRVPVVEERSPKFGIEVPRQTCTTKAAVAVLILTHSLTDLLTHSLTQ